METDARGQLGGLETTDAVRRRLAGESGGYKCGACGRTNAEIMKGCEEAAKEHEATSAGAVAEVEVPKELKMGFRDEMGAAGREGGDLDAESAELAEGFVQTGPLPAAASPGPRGGIVGGEGAAVLPRPGQVPQPTRTVPLPNPRPQGLPRAPVRQQQQVRVSNEAVPAWIDRLIIVLGVLLVAMLIKVLVV